LPLQIISNLIGSNLAAESRKGPEIWTEKQSSLPMNPIRLYLAMLAVEVAVMVLFLKETILKPSESTSL
jgi:hypothetical protein